VLHPFAIQSLTDNDRAQLRMNREGSEGMPVLIDSTGGTSGDSRQIIDISQDSRHQTIELSEIATDKFDSQLYHITIL
jgi:hypothetical protein